MAIWEKLAPKKWQKKNKSSQDSPYLTRDLIGKQGLEKKWEKHLRGTRGNRHIQVDAFGRKNKSFRKQPNYTT